MTQIYWPNPYKVLICSFVFSNNIVDIDSSWLTNELCVTDETCGMQVLVVSWLQWVGKSTPSTSKSTEELDYTL